jgi:hypothetical protein
MGKELMENGFTSQDLSYSISVFLNLILNPKLIYWSSGKL